MQKHQIQTLHDIYNRIAQDIESGTAKEYWSIKRHAKTTREEAYAEAVEMRDKFKLMLEK